MTLEECVRSVRMIVFDFDGVFTDNAVYVLDDGRELVRCSRLDGLGLRKLERLGVATLILSSEENPVVSARSRKLRIPCIQGCRDKRAELERIAAERGLALSQLAYMGNDINDLPCLEAVGLPIIVGDAHQDVMAAGFWRTTLKGGEGAVREVCDTFERVLTQR